MDRKNFLALATVGLVGLNARAQSPSARESSLDVRSFGAKGDGKTDDTEAFAKCLQLNHCAYVPLGDFVVNDLKLGGHLYGIGTLKSTTGQNTVIIQGEGARIEGLRFATLASKAKAEIRLSDGARDASISDCHFEGKAYSVLAADNNGEDDNSLKFARPATRVSFCRNHIRGYIVPLYLHSVTDLIIQGNFFADSFYDAIRLRQAVERAVVSENIFENIGTSKELVSRDAIDSYWSGRELIITGNIVKRTGCIGFDLKGAEPNGFYVGRHMIVANNYIEGTEFSGILVSSGENPKRGPALAVGPVSIQGNTIVGGNRHAQSANDAAIWLRHGIEKAQVHGNQITGHAGHGIAFTNFFPGARALRLIQITHNMVTDCRFKDTAAGLYGHQVEHLQIMGNQIQGCDLGLHFEKIPDISTFKRTLQVEGNYFNPMGHSAQAGWKEYLSDRNRLL